MSEGMQPFLISEFKTGLFEYLQPWIRPIEAFEPCNNAYVYRGSLYKRNGYIPLGIGFGTDNATNAGRMSYQDTIANGNGGKTYSGTLLTNPIAPYSFLPTDGTESFTDNGLGVLTGSAGGTGTIVYSTGAWTLAFNANVGSGVAITAQYTPLLATPRPIMGLENWINEANDTQVLVACDTHRASYFNTTTKMFEPIASVQQIIFQGNGSISTISLATGWVAVAPYTESLAPYSISITDGTSTITDDGAGNLSAAGNFAAGGMVNYTTGVILLNFVAPPAATVYITLTATLTGDYFTGNSSNFFNSTNWEMFLFLTNNVNQITLYDGVNLSRPPFAITQSNLTNWVNNIGATLNVVVYKNSLLVMASTIVNAGGQNGLEPQSIRWSIPLGSPNFSFQNLVADVPGNGGELSAPTSDFIQASGFLRDVVVVFFTNTTWIFRYTGSGFAPFRFDKVSSSKSTNAPYAAVDYDERVTSAGIKGLIACDGVNVQRYDIPIIDQFLQIKQQFFTQCFGLRFDTINQTWMLYPSVASPNNLSDSVLVYNFIENTWSTYTIPLSCLGIFKSFEDVTWADFAPSGTLGPSFPNWESCNFTWDSYLLQNITPALAGGGINGVVYQMDTGETDDGTPITADIVSTRWNPFAKLGQKVHFGWIDFYYALSSTADPAVLTLNFFTDNNSSTATTRTLTLDGPVNADFAWKRVFINNIGEFLRMEISSASTSGFQITGLILWCQPSGRITP